MSLQDRIDAALSAAVQEGRVPGVAAMVTDAQQTRYQGAFGVRTLGQPQAMGVDTVGWIASMTKAITAAAAMQLVERGLLELDAPAFRWLPELASVPVLEGFDAQGRPITRAPRRPVTLRHLLTHTAGFGYDTWNPEVRRYQEALGLPLMASGRRAALMTPLLFDPGQRWNYGIGIDWAGLLVEQASGLRLGEYLARHLFAPLGMSGTGFALTPALRERLARIHQREADGSLRPLHDFEIIQQPEFEGGGGGLYSTAADYLAFLRMILNEGLADDGARVLRPETVDLMSRNHIGGQRVSPMRSLNPARSNDAEFFPGVPKSWGLSFQINEAAAPTGRPAGGLMWAGLSNCYYWIDRGNGLAGVYLTQVLPFADHQALPLYLAMETEVYRALSEGG
jgi:CubicO group peptidase (beta-lactamase class C family)